MLEKVKVGDLAIFKNGEEHKIKYVNKTSRNVSLGFNGQVSCYIRDIETSTHWAYRYNGEWDGDIDDRNDIVKVIHIEEG